MLYIKVETIRRREIKKKKDKNFCVDRAKEKRCILGRDLKLNSEEVLLHVQWQFVPQFLGRQQRMTGPLSELQPGFGEPRGAAGQLNRDIGWVQKHREVHSGQDHSGLGKQIKGS